MASHDILQFCKVAMCLPTAKLYTTQPTSEHRNTKQPVLSKSGSGKIRNLLCALKQEITRKKENLIGLKMYFFIYSFDSVVKFGNFIKEISAFYFGNCAFFRLFMHQKCIGIPTFLQIEYLV